MSTPNVYSLTREQIAAVAKGFQWHRQMPKWTVVVEGRELPARPLVLKAAGVAPNDPTNSHQAVALLKERGFEVRYQGRPTVSAGSQTYEPVTAGFIRSLRGSLRGQTSMVETREREHHREDRT